MIDESIRQFYTQFSFQPHVENAKPMPRAKRFIVAGMGGSHLAANIIKSWNPKLDVVIHSDYGLPYIADEDKDRTLVIASSYSGTTEETVDALRVAHDAGLHCVAIATGHTLIERAKEYGIPYILIPDAGVQPRMALGFSMKAMLTFMQEDEGLAAASNLVSLQSSESEAAGQQLAESLKDCVPIFYSSTRNSAIANICKIVMNETGKIPAFFDVFPEVNHNEMTGFDVKEFSRQLSRTFSVVIFKDPEDHPKIQKRMDVLGHLYEARQIPVRIIELNGQTWFERAFGAIILTCWAAFYTAKAYGLEAEQVPMVEEFKKLIA